MEDKLNVLAPEVIKVDEVDKNNLRVVLEPFERGFGYTVGHSLRRIMLSYMPGAAVTEVKIDGVSHEYGTIEGVKEDILDILLNLKDLAIKLDGVSEAEIKLNIKTPKTVTASDLELPAGVEIRQPSPKKSSILVLLFTLTLIFAILGLFLIIETSLKANPSFIFPLISKLLIFNG